MSITFLVITFFSLLIVGNYNSHKNVSTDISYNCSYWWCSKYQPLVPKHVQCWYEKCLVLTLFWNILYTYENDSMMYSYILLFRSSLRVFWIIGSAHWATYRSLCLTSVEAKRKRLCAFQHLPGFCGGVVEVCAVLGFYTVLVASSLLMFRNSLSVLYSRVKQSWPTDNETDQ